MSAGKQSRLDDTTIALSHYVIISNSISRQRLPFQLYTQQHGSFFDNSECRFVSESDSRNSLLIPSPSTWEPFNPK